jgi:hypothetical protein
MPELKERFSLADEIDTRDLWTEARRRADAPEASARSLPWVPAPRRRVTAAVVAFAVSVAASVFAWNLWHPDLIPMPPPQGVDPPVDLAAELPVGWSELPAPPEVRRDAAIAWTGSKLIQWGGYVYVESSWERPASHEGSIYDAASGRWEQMATGPLPARSAAASAWTGDEFLIWGGATGDCCVPSEMYLDDGAAYDPTARTWRPLPEAPIAARAPLSVWTGHELVVWGSTDRTLRYRDGAAYDPSTNTWRRIADGPIELTDAVAVWSGEEMYVFGAALHGGNFPETETAIGAAYDPASDSWRGLPPSLDTDPNANTAVWADDRLIAMDYGNDVEMYERSSGWQVLERMPLNDGEDVPRAGYVDGWVLVSFYGQVAAFSTDTEEWTDLTDDLTATAPGILYPSAPISAEGVALFFDAGSGHGPRLLAYRPRAPGDKPAVFEPNTDGDGDLIRLPVVFPDGSRATLVYPLALDLATLGVQPDLSYVWDGYFPIVFIHDPNASIEAFVDPEGPVRLVNSSAGGLEIWRARGNDVDQRFWIRFELPSWTVLVSVRDALEDALTVAGALDLTETGSGFPLVQASGPATLAEGFGEAGGAQLAFGDGTAAPDTVSQLDATIFLSPDGCTSAANGEWSGGYGSVCLGDGKVFASIYGDREFVTSVIEGLRVEDFREE